MTFEIEVTWQVTWQVLILTSIFIFPSKALLHHIDNATGWSGKTLSLPRTYVTQRLYSHSLKHTQLRLSHLSTDCLLAKAWSLLLFGATVGGDVEKLVGRNWSPLSLVIRRQLFHWIAKVMARWQRPKASRPIATGLDGCTFLRLWFWYTIGYRKTWLGRAKSGVDKDVYLV